MSGERFIIVDPTPDFGEPERYLGLAGWHRTIRAADPFDSESDAERHAQNIPHAFLRNRVVVRRVVHAGTRRARAAAQAAEDNVATMRAELEGLRATDAEMAAKLAAVTAERDEAQRELAELRRAIEVLTVRMGG